MRAFVAVEITEPSILEGLRGLQAELVPPDPSSVKLTDLKKLHITLQFLGDIPDGARRPVADALSGVEFAPFDLEVGGSMGAFPNTRSPKVVWVGMRVVVRGGGSSGNDDNMDGLHDLAQEVSSALSPLGYKRDMPFSPHITVLRVGSGGAEITRKLGGVVSEKIFGVQKVRAFKLKESRQTPGGHAYADLAVVEGAA